MNMSSDNFSRVMLAGLAMQGLLAQETDERCYDDEYKTARGITTFSPQSYDPATMKPVANTLLRTAQQQLAADAVAYADALIAELIKNPGGNAL